MSCPFYELIAGLVVDGRGERLRRLHTQQVIPPHAPPLVDIALCEVGVVRGDEQIVARPKRRVVGQRLL